MWLRQNILPALTLLAVSSVGLWVQLRIYPNHDIAWVLWGANQMLHGAKFGRDIIAANPPLIWYLSMAPAALAEWLNLPLDRPFTVAVALAGTLSASSLVWLRPSRMGKSHAIVLAAAAAATLVVLPGREFGQREPLMMIAVLPYLALSARRFEGQAISVLRAAVIGVVAGVGLALKPYFLAVPALVEVAVQMLGMKPQRLLRPENIGIVAVIFAYSAWLLAFEQPYLRYVVPLEQEIYWAFNIPLSVIVIPLLVYLLGAAGLVALSFQRKDGLGIVFTAALLALALSYVVQHKGYSYHLMPIQTLAILLGVRVMLDVDVSRLLRIGAGAIATLLALIWFQRFEMWWYEARPGGSYFQQIEQINHSITRYDRGDGYLVVSIRSYPSFPAGIYTHARYDSRTNTQSFLPAVAQLRAEGHPSLTIERHAREFMMHDLSAKPDLVLINTNSREHTDGPSNFDYLAFYEEDPAFRSEWASYREIEPIGQFRQFVRESTGGGRPIPR